LNKHILTKETSCYTRLEQFITEIHRLAESCEFGSLKANLFGITLMLEFVHDSMLSEHLQMKVELTLEKDKLLICQLEVVREQQGILRTHTKKNL